MRDIATHSTQSASTDHSYVTPQGNTITNLSVYHSTQSEYQERTNFTGTFFFLAVDKNDITIPLTYVSGRWIKNNPHGTPTNFTEDNPNLVYLFFGIGEHSGGGTHTYRIKTADTVRFPDFVLNTNVTL